METNVKHHEEVVNKVHELKTKTMSSNENEKNEAVAELWKIHHFYLGVSGIAESALIETGNKKDFVHVKNMYVAKRKQNTGKAVLQIAIVAVMFAIFANANEAWYFSFAKALGLYIAIGFAIYLTGGLKYFKKSNK